MPTPIRYEYPSESENTKNREQPLSSRRIRQTGQSRDNSQYEASEEWNAHLVESSLQVGYRPLMKLRD